VTYFKVLSQHFALSNEVKPWEISVSIPSLLNINQEC